MSIKHALSALLLVTSAVHAQVRTDEGRVVLPSFAIDRTEVTIAQFERYVQATANLNDEERYMVYEGNARRVFKRLDDQLTAKGK